MKVYSPSDVSKQLNIKPSTLRKYSLLLEESGMTFQRNNQNQRWYTDNDVIALRKLITFKENGDMSLKECADAVCAWASGKHMSQPHTAMRNDIKRYESDMEELKEIIHNQNKLIESIHKRFDDYKAFILDRDEKLVKELRNTLESKRKKGIFARFFKRK